MNNQSQMMNQHQMMNIAPSQGAMVNQPMIAPPPMMDLNYGQWSQRRPNMALPPASMNTVKFANPNHINQIYVGIAKPGRNSWKKKGNQLRWKDNGYQSPSLNELEHQNRLRARSFFHKKKFNRMGPYAHAPRNTTSYIIRAKKSGGIASLVSPCPVTPAVLPTPVFSPSREALVDMAKEEWGVDGYGTMKGLIRVRSLGHDDATDDFEEDEDDGSSGSDVEEHVEVERRLDHDLNRFEMIYPNNSGVDYHNVLENRVDDHDTHIAQLEEEKLILKERLYLMERKVGDMRRRLSCLERHNRVVEDVNEEVVENVSGNISEAETNYPHICTQHNEEVDFVPRDGGLESGATTRDDSGDEMVHTDSSEGVMKEDDNHEEDEQVQEVKKEQHNEAVGSSELSK